MSSEEERKEAYSAKIEFKLKLAQQCRQIIRMPEFMQMLENGYKDAINAARASVGEQSARHFGAAMGMKDLEQEIREATEFRPPAEGEDGQKRCPMYE